MSGILQGVLSSIGGVVPNPSDPNFRNVSLLLTGNGTNGAQNNTFLDSSTNNFTITRNGNTTQGSFSPYGPNWSNYFGNNNCLIVSNNAAFNFGTSDFNFECYVFADVLEGTQIFYDGTVNGAFAIGTTGGGANLVVALSNQAVLNQVTVNLQRQTWYHIAISRSGTTLRFFLDGTLVSTQSNSTNLGLNGGNLAIGAARGVTEYWQGYVSNMRVVKGSAIYTASFIPPTTPLTAVSGTSLLTCQSNRFVDNSTNNFAITPNGTPSVQRFSPFNPSASYVPATGGGSGYFDGTDDYLRSSSSNAFAFGTGDFTMEAWVYPTVQTSSTQGIVSTRISSAGGAFQVFFGINSGAILYFGGSGFVGSGGTVVLNSWQHIACSRQSGTVRVFLNGVLVASVADGNDKTTTFGYVASGAGDSGQVFAGGYISDARFVKGTALYTANFTPPTTPLTAVTNTSLLANFTNAGIPDAATQNNLETVGNAQVSTAVAKYGTGSLAFDGSGDYLIAPNNSVFNLSSGNFTIEFWFNTNTLAPATSNIAALVGCQQFGTNGWGVWQLGEVIGFYWSDPSLSNISTGNVITATNTWYHIAVVRSGTATNNTKIYINGVQQAQGSPTILNSTQVLSVGGVNTTTGWDQPYYTNGYIDDLRMTKGLARYTANFTPPTAALPTF